MENPQENKENKKKADRLGGQFGKKRKPRQQIKKKWETKKEKRRDGKGWNASKKTNRMGGGWCDSIPDRNVIKRFLQITPSPIRE